MMWGIELDRAAAPVAKELLSRGFIVGTARQNVLRLLPPYITPKKAFMEFMTTLEKILEVEERQSLPALQHVAGVAQK
jgi:acetylornithine/N-succinyldiaminopimelate aminotransferase